VAVAGSHHYHSLSLKMLLVCLYPPRVMVLHGKYRLVLQHGINIKKRKPGLVALYDVMPLAIFSTPENYSKNSEWIFMIFRAWYRVQMIRFWFCILRCIWRLLKLTCFHYFIIVFSLFYNKLTLLPPKYTTKHHWNQFYTKTDSNEKRSTAVFVA